MNKGKIGKKGGVGKGKGSGEGLRKRKRVIGWGKGVGGVIEAGKGGNSTMMEQELRRR